MYLCNWTAKSAERKALAWLRKRIHPYCWGTSDRHKEGFSRTTKRRILDFFLSLRMGNRRCYLPKPKTKDFMAHFAGMRILYFQSDGRRKTPETIVLLDIDCHSRGSYEGAVRCVVWLIANGFPNLFWSRSTNGRGIHAYVVIEKWGSDEWQLDRVLLNLERWLQYQHHMQKWDIELIEVKGRPPLYHWGVEKYELTDISLGSLAKVPVELLDRPEELMATTRLSVRKLDRLGSLVPSGWDAGRYCSTYRLPIRTREHVEVTPEEIRRWVPGSTTSMWCPWVERTARIGLTEDDTMGKVVYELAKWLLWVELFDSDDRMERTTDLLQRFVLEKHNGHVSRLLEGKEREVLSQVDRIVKTASGLSGASREVFARIREARREGKYWRQIRIEPVLCGEERAGEQQEICSTYSLPIRDDRLPPEIEVKLTAFAKSQGMRLTQGEYPFLRFSRRFLNILYDKKGCARIGTEDLTSFVTNVHQQDRFKRILRGLGLIRDWAGTYRQGTEPCLYRLTDEAMAIMNRNAESTVESPCG